MKCRSESALRTFRVTSTSRSFETGGATYQANSILCFNSENPKPNRQHPRPTPTTSSMRDNQICLRISEPTRTCIIKFPADNGTQCSPRLSIHKYRFHNTQSFLGCFLAGNPPVSGLVSEALTYQLSFGATLKDLIPKVPVLKKFVFKFL